MKVSPAWVKILLMLLLPLAGHGQYLVDWARAGAGPGTNRGNLVATDSENNIYLSGSHQDTLLIGDQILVSNGDTEFFLAKYSPRGELLWVNNIGGSSITLDSENNLYITGSFSSSIQLDDSLFTTQGLADYYIASFDPQGNLRWAQVEGGPDNDWGTDVAIDPQGYLYVSGRYGEGMEFQDTVFQEQAGQMFIAKYTLSGQFLWVKSYYDLRSAQSSNLFGDSFRGQLDVDYSGNLVVAATYWDRDAVNDQILVLKTDSSGVPLWNEVITSGDEGMSALEIFANSLNELMIYGSQASTLSVLGTPITAGGIKPFLVKFDANGNVLWGHSYSDNDDMGSLRGARINHVGESYLLADFSAVILGGFDLTSADEVIFKVDTAGNVINAMGFAKQSERTDAFDLVLDQFENIVVTGYFRRDFELGDTVLIPTPDPNDPFVATYDLFLVKYNACDFDSINFLLVDTLTTCPHTSPLIQAYEGTACGFSYQWDHGPTTASVQIQPDSSQFYYLTVTDSSVQQRRDSIFVVLLDFSPPNLSPDQVLCQGETLTLDAGPGYETYLWSTGEITPSIEVTASGTYTLEVTSTNGCQATDTVTVTQEVCTGLPDISQSGLFIYPNPSQGEFTITTSQPIVLVQLQITDLQGREHFYQELHQLVPGDHTLRVNLPAGLYILFLETPEQRYQGKLLME